MKKLYRENQFEDTTLRDNPSDWMAEELKLEARVSAWDLDNCGSDHRELHYNNYDEQRDSYESNDAENTDYADRLHKANHQNTVRPAQSGQKVRAQQTISVVVFVYILMMFISLIITLFD